jgi:hypothetical protein
VGRDAKIQKFLVARGRYALALEKLLHAVARYAAKSLSYLWKGGAISDHPHPKIQHAGINLRGARKFVTFGSHFYATFLLALLIWLAWEAHLSSFQVSYTRYSPAVKLI